MVILTKDEDNQTVEYYNWEHYFTETVHNISIFISTSLFISEVFYMYQRQVVRKKKQH